MARYDIDSFDPQPDPDLVCCICHCVLDDPKESPCRHVFCRVCIQTWLLRCHNCPTCRKRIVEDDLKSVLPMVQNMINRLKMRCEYEGNGCSDRPLLEHYETHKQQCGFQKNRCKYARCGQEVLKMVLTQHEEQECEYRETQCQKDCKLMILVSSLEQHSCLHALQNQVKEYEAEIEKLKQTCEDLKKENSDLSSKLQNAKNEVENEAAAEQSNTSDNLSVYSSSDEWVLSDSDSHMTEYTIDNVSDHSGPEDIVDNQENDHNLITNTVEIDLTREDQRHNNINDENSNRRSEDSGNVSTESSHYVSAGSSGESPHHIGSSQNNNNDDFSNLSQVLYHLNDDPVYVNENNQEASSQNYHSNHSVSERGRRLSSDSHSTSDVNRSQSDDSRVHSDDNPSEFENLEESEDNTDNDDDNSGSCDSEQNERGLSDEEQNESNNETVYDESSQSQKSECQSEDSNSESYHSVSQSTNNNSESDSEFDNNEEARNEMEANSSTSDDDDNDEDNDYNSHSSSVDDDRDDDDDDDSPDVEEDNDGDDDKDDSDDSGGEDGPSDDASDNSSNDDEGGDTDVGNDDRVLFHDCESAADSDTEVESVREDISPLGDDSLHVGDDSSHVGDDSDCEELTQLDLQEELLQLAEDNKKTGFSNLHFLADSLRSARKMVTQPLKRKTDADSDLAVKVMKL